MSLFANKNLVLCPQFSFVILFNTFYSLITTRRVNNVVINKADSFYSFRATPNGKIV